MHEEEFAQGGSAIHLMDPRLKIVLAAVFSVIVAVSTRYPVMIAALAIAAALVAAARLDFLLVLRRLVLVNLFVALMWLFLPFTTPGARLFSLGPLVGTAEGVKLALQITVKSNAIILAGMGMLSTTSLANLGHALSRLGVPNKLVQLFFFTVRYSYTVHEEYIRLKNSLKVRCFRSRTTVHTYRTYAYMVARLLLGSFERSGRILSAMKCRGFKNRFPVLERLHFHLRDVVFLLLFLPLLAAMGLLEWTRILSW